MSAEDLVKIGTLKQALETLRGAGRIYVHVRIDALLFNDPDSYFPHGWSGGVAITKQAARKFVTDLFSGWDASSTHDTNKYFRMSVRMSPGNLVRKRNGELVPGKPIKTVWIGA